MSILIVGSEGSMGKRYQAILKHLGQPFKCADLLHDDKWVDKMASTSHGIIIATPTNTHLKILRRFSQMDRPILCEKPLVKTKSELSDLISLVRTHRLKLRMMYQYQLLDNKDSSGVSSYDYFRHGNDGIVWDCMQIISLARSEIEIAENSPVWKCKINGESLNLSHMDQAYIDCVKLWFNYPVQDLFYLSDIHQKTMDYEKKVSGGEFH